MFASTYLVFLLRVPKRLLYLTPAEKHSRLKLQQGKIQKTEDSYCGVRNY